MVKRFSTGAASALLVFGSLLSPAYGAVAGNALYTDVAAGAYGANQIVTLSEDGYLHGFSNGTFRPNDVITRGEFLVYFMAVAQNTTHVGPRSKSRTYFSDVPPGSWLFSYIGAAVSAGWLTPAGKQGAKTGGRFGANAAVTRQGAAALFVSAMERAGRLHLPAGVLPLQYADNAGIFRGVKQSATAALNRASAAIVLYNMLAWMDGTLLPKGDVPVVSSKSQVVDATAIVPLTVSLRTATGRIASVPAHAQVSYAVQGTPAGAIVIAPTHSLIMTSPGVYRVVATVDGVASAAYKITAVQQPAAIQVSAARSLLVADGTQQDVITATVVDAAGQRMAGFNGTAALLPLSYGTYVNPATGAPITSVAFSGGIAHFAVQAGTSGGVSDMVSLQDLAPKGGLPLGSINYGSVMVQYTWPNNHVSAVQLSPAAISLTADGEQTAKVKATVTNSYGQAITTFNGTATLSPLTHGSYIDPATHAAITSVSFTNGVAQFEVMAGTTGGVTDSVALGDLTSAQGQPLTNVTYGAATVNYAWPTAQSLQLTSDLPAVSDNQANQDPVSVTVADASGAALTAGSPVQVVLTLSGPGSFQNGGSPVTTVQEYVTPGQPLKIPVWSIPNMPGTVVIQASASGLVPGQTSIRSVSTGEASSLVVHAASETVSALGAGQAPALAQGTPFNLYTVVLEDAGGNPVMPPAADMLTVSDNSSAAGAQLAYYAVVNGQPEGSPLSPGELAAAISPATGQTQFAVVNLGAGTMPPTITVADAEGHSTSIKDTFSSGSAVYAMFPLDTPSASGGAVVNLEAGQTATYAVQAEDVNGNPVSTAGQSVNFYFTGKNVAQAVIDGSAAWSTANPFTTVTDPQGQAFVTITVPQGAVGSFALTAAVPGEANTSTQTVVIESPAQYATQLILSGAQAGTISVAWPTVSMMVGQSLTQYVGQADPFVADLYATPVNYLGSAVGGTDELKVTTSNPAVLGIAPSAAWTAPNGSAMSVVGSASSPLPVITAVAPGIATITISDITNPSAPSITETIDVTQ